MKPENSHADVPSNSPFRIARTDDQSTPLHVLDKLPLPHSCTLLKLDNILLADAEPEVQMFPVGPTHLLQTPSEGLEWH